MAETTGLNLAAFSSTSIFQLNWKEKPSYQRVAWVTAPYLESLKTSILQNSGSVTVPDPAWPGRRSLFHALSPVGR